MHDAPRFMPPTPEEESRDRLPPLSDRAVRMGMRSEFDDEHPRTMNPAPREDPEPPYLDMDGPF